MGKKSVEGDNCGVRREDEHKRREESESGQMIWRGNGIEQSLQNINSSPLVRDFKICSDGLVSP